jgi:hypothetical protein
MTDQCVGRESLTFGLRAINTFVDLAQINPRFGLKTAFLLDPTLDPSFWSREATAMIAHQRIAMPGPESKEGRAAGPVISQVLPREPDGKGMKKRSNGGGCRCHRCWPDGKTEILAKGMQFVFFNTNPRMIWRNHAQEGDPC